MPETHEMEGHHPKWLAFLAEICRASEPMMRSLEDQDGVLLLDAGAEAEMWPFGIENYGIELSVVVVLRHPLALTTVGKELLT